MELRRFFVSPSDISGDEVVLRGDEFAHMTRVLRMKKGFKVIVCADDGTERLCTVKDIFSDSALLTVDEVNRVDRKSANVTLYCGLLKNQKLDFVVQKAVELGIDRIIPFVSENSAETKFNTERARRIALEAAKQCGTAYLSQVCDPVKFDDVLADFPQYTDVLFAYERERKNPVRNTDFKGRKIALVVGSEGGFTEAEYLKALECGARSVTLGRRILRAETADIVLCALTLDTLGELDYDE